MIKIYKHFSLILTSILLFTACSIKEPENTTPIKPDDIELLASSAKDESIDSQKASKDFFEKYFKPWNASKVSTSKIEAMWGHSYKSKQIYL